MSAAFSLSLIVLCLLCRAVKPVWKTCITSAVKKSQQTAVYFNQSGTKWKPIKAWLSCVFPRLAAAACFPAFCTVCVFCFDFWLVLTYLHVLWLVKCALVLVLWQWSENSSNNNKDSKWSNYGLINEASDTETWKKIMFFTSPGAAWKLLSGSNTWIDKHRPLVLTQTASHCGDRTRYEEPGIVSVLFIDILTLPTLWNLERTHYF